MDNLQLNYCIIIGLGQLLIAHEFAKYGFPEIGIKRPFPKKIFLSFAIFLAINMYVKFIAKIDKFDIGIMDGLICLGPSALWFIIFRAYLVSTGAFYQYKATTASIYWSQRNYIPGEATPEGAELLNKFQRAKNTLTLFDKAIEKQKHGSKRHFFNATYPPGESGYGQINMKCPCCSNIIQLPEQYNTKLDGHCNMCGSAVTAIINSKEIRCSAHSFEGITTIDDRNRMNIATAYEEKALLLRMMGRYEDALSELDSAMKQVELIDGSDKGALSIKSLIIFRRSEIHQVLNRKNDAAKGYRECLKLDKESGNMADHNLTKHLLEQVK